MLIEMLIEMARLVTLKVCRLGSEIVVPQRQGCICCTSFAFSLQAGPVDSRQQRTWTQDIQHLGTPCRRSNNLSTFVHHQSSSPGLHVNLLTTKVDDRGSYPMLQILFNLETV